MTKQTRNKKPKTFLESLRQLIQDLLVPELKAIQVTLQHHSELIQGLQQRVDKLEATMEQRFAKVDERFAKVDERFDKVDERFEKVDERFTQVWQAILQLTEAQQHTQAMLQRVLDRLDILDALRETQTRQKVVEAQVEDLRGQVQHLRALLEMVLRQQGLQPPPTP